MKFKNRSKVMAGMLTLGLPFSAASATEIQIVNGDFEADAADNINPPAGWTDLSESPSFWTGVPDEVGNPSAANAATAPEPGIGTYFLTTARQSAEVEAQPTNGLLTQSVDLSAFGADIDNGDQSLTVAFIYSSNDDRDTGSFSLHFFSSADGSGPELGSGYSVNLDAGTGFAFSGWQEPTVGGLVPVGARSVTLQISTTRSGGSETNIWIDNITGDLGEADSDGDGLPDSFEQRIIDFDADDDVESLADVAGPNDAPDFVTDYDFDGLSDAEEFAADTDPLDFDSDDDGLDDGPEVEGTDNDGVSHGFGPTDPLAADSDGDGIDDFDELDGLGPDGLVHGFGATNPNEEDSDDDDLPDLWEIQNGLNPNSSAGDDGAGGDPDEDGLDNTAELANGTNPNETDTDGDGLDDAAELAGTNNDGTPHGFGPTNPAEADSDGDGFDDGLEIAQGSDPSDFESSPGTPVAFVNGGFEEPVVTTPTVGIPVSGNTVPGWSAVENDFYVIDALSFIPDTGTPDAANEGDQFASPDRRAPEPDLAPEAFDGGINATMSMRQDLDVSSFAGEIDGGARTLWVSFDWFDNDVSDEGVVMLNFLDTSGTDLGRRAIFRTGETAGTVWNRGLLRGYPPAGTRTVRVTVAVVKVDTGASTARNGAFDDFRAGLFHLDADEDGMADDWEEIHGLDPTDPTDADGDSDGDTLDNLEEFELGTNPTLADTDGDGFDDDEELAAGTDPLDADSAPASNIRVVGTAMTVEDGQVTRVEVTFSGLNPNIIYVLRRGTDLVTFPDAVDTFQPPGETETFFDQNPPTNTLSGKAFYILEEQ